MTDNEVNCTDCEEGLHGLVKIVHGLETRIVIAEREIEGQEP